MQMTFVDYLWQRAPAEDRTPELRDKLIEEWGTRVVIWSLPETLNQMGMYVLLLGKD